MSISSNLKTIRSQRGMTQGNLADKAGIELTQVSRIERGASEPKLETIKKLAIALSCSTDELIMDEQVQKPEYIKRTVERIDKLSPLNKYIVLSMINSYCSQNQIPEPSLHEMSSQDERELEHIIADSIKTAYQDDLKELSDLQEDIGRDLHELDPWR